MSPKRRSPLNNPPSASLSDKPEADEIPEEEEEEEDQEPEVARGGGDEDDDESEEEDEDDDESEEEDEVDDESEEEEKSYPVSGSDSDSDCDSVTDSDSISVGSKRHAQTESSASVSRGRKKAKIWNGRIGQETNVEEEDTEVDSKRFWSHYPLLKESMRSSLGSVPDNLLMKALKSIGRTKAKEMEEEWRELMLEEWRLRLRQIDFIKKQAQLILEALDSSKASEICQVSEIDDEYL